METFNGLRSERQVEGGEWNLSPLLVGEQLVTPQPGGDPGVMGQAVLGAGRLQHTDLRQNLKLLQGGGVNRGRDVLTPDTRYDME